MDEWRKNMWHIYLAEYYSPIEKNGILCFIENWTKLEAHCTYWNKSDIGDHQCMFPFICGCWRELIWIYSNLIVATEGERKGKNDWTVGTKVQVKVIGGRGWGASSVGTVCTGITIWVEIPMFKTQYGSTRQSWDNPRGSLGSQSHWLSKAPGQWEVNRCHL